MKRFIRAIAVALTVVGYASASQAITITPFNSPLSAGMATNGSATADAGEDFASTTLSVTAAEDLSAAVSITINPFLVSPGGTPSNTIALAYSVNGGASTALSVIQVMLPFPLTGSIGASGLSIDLADGDTLQFFINGTAGPSGNQVTFAVETMATVIPLPAAGLLLLAGMGAFVFTRRKPTSA